MNEARKSAFFSLFLGVPGMVICSLTFYWIAWTGIIENPLTFWLGLWIGCTFAGLMWIIPTFRSPRKNFDERDMIIYKRATLIGYAVVWVYFVTAVIYVGWYVGPQGSVTTSTMLGIIFGGLILFMPSNALAILLQYGRGFKGE